MSEDYQFDDIDPNAQPAKKPGYAIDLFTAQIKAKFRVFFVDLKESANGKFLKISEKSNGRKSTIIMDAEDIPEFMNAMQEIQSKL